MVVVRADKIRLIEDNVPNNSMESLSQAYKRKLGKEVLHNIDVGSFGHWLLTSKGTLLEAVPSLRKNGKDYG